MSLNGLLTAVEAAPPVAAADAIGAVLAETIGAREVSFLIADFSGQSLMRLGHSDSIGARRQGGETAQRVPLAGTPHGRALIGQTIEVLGEGAGARLLAPVTSRGEPVGLLELCLDAPPDAQTVADVALAAHALAYVLVANHRYTDLFEWGQRSMPLSLAAEIQHRLLPGSNSCEAGQFTIAAGLEPAGQVGGDTFDFALDRDVLHLSITDAMGHLVEASLLATVLVGALRNARRAGVALADQARLANQALVEYSRAGQFVTGQLVRIDLINETATIVNAGHPPPLRLTDSGIERVALDAEPPFGIAPDHPYRVQSLPLHPGDRLMFVTDGMLERNAANLQIETVLLAGTDLHPREAVRHLTHAILDASGEDLRDDATVVCLDWHGGPLYDREAAEGADH